MVRAVNRKLVGHDAEGRSLVQPYDIPAPLASPQLQRVTLRIPATTIHLVHAYSDRNATAKEGKSQCSFHAAWRCPAWHAPSLQHAVTGRTSERPVGRRAGDPAAEEHDEVEANR